MTRPKPRVVHVYRHRSDGTIVGLYGVMALGDDYEYLGPYVPRGEVVREWYELRYRDTAIDSCEASNKRALRRMRAAFKSEGGNTRWELVRVTRRKAVRGT